jgi:hypothetical protein
MAFSLGLHRDQVDESATALDREQHRRIWWTLFQLDLEISSRGGCPTVIDERFTKVTTPMPSERVCPSSLIFDAWILTDHRLYIRDSIHL